MFVIWLTKSKKWNEFTVYITSVVLRIIYQSRLFYECRVNWTGT